MSKEKRKARWLFFGKDKYTYDTIDELVNKSMGLAVGEVVTLNGYYSADDGATHKRVIADTDDGSGVQLRSGKWANIVHNGEVNVSWFGAKGDGVTDDTEAIQKAIHSSRITTLDCKKVYSVTKTITVGSTEKVLTSKNIVDDNMPRIKYMGNLNQKGAVIVVGNNNVGEFDLDASSIVLSGLIIDANNLCGIGVYSTYITNETKIENIITYNTLEYGMYFAKAWYATFRNLTSEKSKGNGIAFGMPLRYSDGNVVLPSTENMLQVNSVFISNIRTHSCGKDIDNQDYKYAYGIGIGYGYNLNIINSLAERGGIGYLIYRKFGGPFSLRNFDTEGNVIGICIDTRDSVDNSAFIGSLKNGSISDNFKFLNGAVKGQGNIILENITSVNYIKIDDSDLFTVRNCAYNFNKYQSPSLKFHGKVLYHFPSVNVRYTSAAKMENIIPYPSYDKRLWLWCPVEYQNVNFTLKFSDYSGVTLSTKNITSSLKEGFNFISLVEDKVRKIEIAQPNQVDLIADFIITDNATSDKYL